MSSSASFVRLDGKTTTLIVDCRDGAPAVLHWGAKLAAGLDPESLPTSDASAMNFGTDRKAKAWRDIWGCGQGIGAVKDVPSAADLVARLSAEYEQAKRELAVKTALTVGRPFLAAE